MWQLVGIDHCFQLAVFGIDHNHLVGGVGSDLEVAASGIEETVMQELGGVDLVDAQVVDIGVIDLPHLTQLLHRNQPALLVRRIVDSGYAGLFHIVTVHVHATRGDHFQRLHAISVNNHEVRRPVAATDNVLAITGDGDVTSVIGDLGFSNQHLVRCLEQIDLGQLAVTTHGVPETTFILRLGDLGVLQRLQHVHRITGRNVSDDLMLIAINNGHFTDITLDDDEEVLPVAAMQRLGRIILRINIDLGTLFHELE